MTLAIEHLDYLPREVELRPADAAEVALGGMSAFAALADSHSRSLHSYRAMWERETFAYWGWAPLSLMGDTCAAWMLTTPFASTIPLAFGRLTRQLFRELRTHYPVILVQVDPAHALALRWLEWLGFEPSTDFSAPPFLILSTRRKT